METFINDLEKNINEKNSIILGLDEFDPMLFSEQYFNSKTAAEISIDPNANVSGISPNNYLTEIGKPHAKKFFFSQLYKKGVGLFGKHFSLRHIYDGTIYIHDATKIQPYCFGLSATEIATLGRPYSNLPALPPKRLESFMGQLTEFIMDCSQEFAGAIAITDLVPWIAWFVEKDNEKIHPVDFRKFGKLNNHGDYYLGDYTDKQIENVFQSFVHVLNNSFRIGGDSPFTNISINSKRVYYDIFEHYVFPDGKTVDDLWTTIKRVQRIIIDFMGKGRPDGLPYKFPILTANFKSTEKEMESEWFRYVGEHNATGFMNVNFAERFAMCCRLQLDFDFKQNSFGGGGVKVGSMRVANLNLPRIAYKSITESESENDACFYGSSLEFYFFNVLDYYIDYAIEYLLAYREIFKEEIDKGYLKFFREPSKWFDINMFFATVGFCGIWDAAEIIYPYNGYETEEKTINVRVEFMERIILYIVNKTKNQSNGVKFNVEQVPSESAAGKMAKFNKDYGETREYYSNQFIPLQIDIPLHKRIEYEAKLQSKLTGGGMTFLNFDSKLTPIQSYEIHEHMLKSGFTGQFCINYGYTHCPECSITEFGKHKRICKCDVDPDFYTRVVGYLAKLKDTAKSKAIEIGDRRSYSTTESSLN